MFSPFTSSSISFLLRSSVYFCKPKLDPGKNPNAIVNGFLVDVVSFENNLVDEVDPVVLEIVAVV